MLNSLVRILTASPTPGLALRTIMRVRFRSGLAQLDATPNPSPLAGSITSALRRSLEHRFDAADREWFRRIEAVRREMEASDELIEGWVGPTPIRRSCRRGSKTPFWGQLLYSLVREIRPGAALELGSNVGISAMYQAAAQARVGSGRLVTLEGAPGPAAVAARNLAGLGLESASVVPGRFHDTLDSVLHELAPVDYAFIDGHHDEEATLGYFETLAPKLSPGAVLVFDDIAWSDGMRRAWRAIRRTPGVTLVVDLHSVGICVVEGRMQAS